MAIGPREGRVLHAMSIDDTYEVQRVLSSGPGGRTEVVAIDGFGPYLRKKIPSSLVDRRVWTALSECASLRLPHVVATYETPDEFVVVCDFVPGDTLHEIVSARGRLPVSEAVRIALDVCEAVEELHRRGIAHCDISPRNVLVAADGAHLIDLGIARPLGTGPSSESPHFGTHGFAAPEQYGFAPVDERTDVCAMAHLLGYMLTGLEPGDAYRAVLTDESVVPAPLRAVIERGSAFEPSARFQTIRDFAHAVDEGSKGAFPQAASRVGTSSCENLGASGVIWDEDDSCNGSAASSGGRGRAKKRRTAIVAVSCIAAILIALGAISYATLPNVLGAEAAGHDGGSGNQTKGGQSSSYEVPPIDGGAPGAADESLLEEGFSESAAAFSKEDLVVVESSWHMSNGYISYVVALRNASKDTVVDYPAFSIVGRDSEGKIVSSEEQVLPRLNPGETMYFSSIAGTGTVTPRSVDFLPIAPDEYQVHRARSEGAVFRVTDVSATTDTFGEVVFVGEAIWEAGEKGEDATSDILVTVVLRDDAGEMVGGVMTLASCPERGVPVAFQTLGEDVPDYASIEAYAYAW